MESRVIVQMALNVPPQEEVNAEIQKLGDGWHIVSASTALQIFAISEDKKIPELPMVPMHHCSYVTTVVMQKD